MQSMSEKLTSSSNIDVRAKFPIIGVPDRVPVTSTFKFYLQSLYDRRKRLDSCGLDGTPIQAAWPYLVTKTQTINFVVPLFTRPSATERELQAVTAEHSKNVQNDAPPRRLYPWQKSRSNPRPAFHKFGTGNLESLGTIPRAKPT
ncbi:hypothetical protein PsorP6_017350 [Peronosclerospora sorghi]|uniref:Uncharacterized protein n=1 Tax=Peronosclerospora sorghi TaxID=230839 RepID=A0ACC0WN89_9STRA|nr:hypothetical protein PsorP6_018373 [Peronosclerospora sorghi]KAI9919368.1 hypothetical protein PsorP6_017350 [Peronosclerospora sorghi]